jgi:hypothetical protein
MPPSQRTMETIAEIAYIAGEFQYYGGDSRKDIAEYFEWAEEFESARQVDPDGNETYGGLDYISAIWDFTRRKIGEYREPDAIRQIPPNPDGRNGERAEWAFVAIEAFENRTNCDREDAISDLLTDLMHWCDRHNVDFKQEMRRARGMYEDETDGDEEAAQNLGPIEPIAPMPPPPEDVPF